MTHSLSMHADGLHSSFDGLSNVIGLFGLWLKNLSATIDFCTNQKFFYCSNLHQLGYLPNETNQNKGYSLVFRVGNLDDKASLNINCLLRLLPCASLNGIKKTVPEKPVNKIAVKEISFAHQRSPRHNYHYKSLVSG